MKKKVIKSKELTNEQVYKTVEERDKAFNEFCKSQGDCMKCRWKNCSPSINCAIKWLSEKYVKPKPKVPFEVDERVGLSFIRRTDTGSEIICIDSYDGGFYWKDRAKQLCESMNDAALAWHKNIIGGIND